MRKAVFVPRRWVPNSKDEELDKLRQQLSEHELVQFDEEDEDGVLETC